VLGAARAWSIERLPDNQRTHRDEVLHGTEFTAKALDDWAYRRGIKLNYTRPGKPTDNGLIESFNGRLRDEFLNVKEFITLHDAWEKLKAWQDD
jgi:putative transposase